jgi:hypothetical protein
MENSIFREKYFGLVQAATEGNKDLIFDAPLTPTLCLSALGEKG